MSISSLKGARLIVTHVDANNSGANELLINHQPSSLAGRDSRTDALAGTANANEEFACDLARTNDSRRLCFERFQPEKQKKRVESITRNRIGKLVEKETGR